MRLWKSTPIERNAGRFRNAMISLASLLLLVVQAQVPPAGGFSFFEPVQPSRSLQVMAHRGAARLAPENTARALEAAIADTVEWAEVDVRRTRDGHHVLFHDDALDGKTDAAGRVRDRTLAEVRSADAGSKFSPRFAGERILTLEEGLQLARGRINLYFDCKDVDPTLLAREVLAAKMGRQVVVYASPDTLRAVRDVAGDAVGLMTKWRPASGVTQWVKDVGVHAVEIDADDVTAAACREFHRSGIKVQAKTLGEDDRPEVWDRMAAAGVDWVQTDRAEEVLARQSLKKIGPGRVRVAHHRGAGRYAPENTLESLRKALALGADFVEFDVRTTRDGGFVLLHDGSLNRTTSGRGMVRQRAAAEVAALDAGSWFGRPFAGSRVPTLDAFLDAATPSGVWLYVDAKDIAPEALAGALARHGLTDRAVVYQGVAYLEKLKSVAPTLRRMPPLHDPSQLDAIAERVRPYAVDARWTILSKPLIDRCHALEIKVFSDAIGANESVERYQRAVRDGLDLIQTDHPVRVLRALELLERSALVRP
jgi:glycerophosphoryl diester phosphodiesterase